MSLVTLLLLCFGTLDPVFGIIHAGPPAEDPLSGVVHVAPGGELSVELLFAPGFPPPESFLDPERAEGQIPERFQTEQGGAGLRFPPSTTPDAVAVLRQAQDALRARDGETAQLPVTVHIPATLEGADIWDLQAALSRAGIRRVRIRSGG
ncbi:MAG: hypothetical protein EA422_12510 [Gemmatimonadales bacterium]|nr:MAG: hypothetical protein EA422_12510 [Gemmatimonadales bacterium]